MTTAGIVIGTRKTLAKRLEEDPGLRDRVRDAYADNVSVEAIRKRFRIDNKQLHELCDGIQRTRRK